MDILARLRVKHINVCLDDFGVGHSSFTHLYRMPFNEVKLDPKLLCGCISVCEEIFDTAPCFALQDKHVIEPLLQAATAEALPLERQSYAAGLAAELTVKLGLDPQPVRKVLWKLEHSTRSPEVRLLIAQSMQLLDEGQKA